MCFIWRLTNLLYICTQITIRLNKMTALEVQKKMNKALERRQFKTAYNHFLKLNPLRLAEGMEVLNMPNLVARFEK